MTRRISNSVATLFCFILSLIILQLFALASNARAQDLDDVIIAGRILDQNGSIIPGASVTATLASTGVERSATTNEEGRYRFIELPPGLYTVRASFVNFATAEKRNLATIAGQNVQLDFVLRPSDVIAGQVLITDADASPVDTSRTIVGGTVTALEAEQLPLNTRSPFDLIFTLGGVTEEPLSTRDLAEDRHTDPRATPEEAGTFALSGGPAYSNNLTIDGLDNNDDRAARERFQPSIEAVAEVQVITNQFSAEYGRASGGRVNIRTRGGSKQFHARAFYFFKDESLNSNTVRNNALGLKRLPLQEHDPGFTLSGPLIIPRYFGPLNNHRRDRTFFFAAFESDTTLDSALIDTLVPVRQNSLFPLPAPTALAGRRLEDVSAPRLQAEVAPFIQSVNTPARNNIFTLRLDHKFSDSHNGTLLYQLGRLKNLRQFNGGSRLADALQGQTRDTDALSYSDDYVFNTRTVNQSRLQISRLSPAFKSHGDQSSPVVLINLKDPLAAFDATDRSGTLVAGSSTSGGTTRRETRLQFQDTLTNTRGPHSLKLGFDAQHINSTFSDLSDASGTFNFASAGDFLANQPSRFRRNFQTSSTQRNIYLGLFAQDEWHLRSNLLLSYGLRYERETILRDRNNFGPRIALAYDPFKSGKTVIRLGAAIFYNRALLRTLDDFTLGGQQLFFDTNSLTDPLTAKLLTAEQRRKFIADNLHFPQPLSLDSLLVQQFAVRNTNFTRHLDPTLRIPESYQANLGFERELRHGFVFEANYTWNRGIHLWREFNANAPVLPKSYSDWTNFLLARDFVNFRDSLTGTRPLYNAASAGELVRFTLTSSDPTNPNAVGRINEFGVPISLVNLNSFSSSTSVEVALAALNELRPDPTRAEVEQLASIGNSFYQGLTVELRRRLTGEHRGFRLSFRAAYTFSRLIDDGIVNTSDALRPGDFRSERVRSLLDRRHRFVFSGTFKTPRSLGGLSFSPIMHIASGAPFNISIGGNDRNLDDVSNDRPIFTGDVRRIRARRPGQPLDTALLSTFALPTIGRTGNLPRNAGIGPGIFMLDLNVTREFRLKEGVRLRPVIEMDNLLNKTIFSFGTEFINFSALGPTATAEQRQAFLDSFLVPTRTLRQRQIRVGLRIDF
jgi:hypothetical protein